MTERVANATPRRPSTTKQTENAKAAKRAAAKAAKEKARRAAKRRQVLSMVGSALAVLLVVGGIVWWAQSGKDDSPGTSPSASASGDPAAAGFPQLPEGADPALKTKPVVTAGTGEVTKLGVTTLVEGKGPAVQSGQTISANYVGVTFKDGKEFDASWKRSEPISFQVGTGGVIKGWDQGLVGVKVGSRVQLDIPADLAYGENPGGGKPGGALRFVVDVLSAA